MIRKRKNRLAIVVALLAAAGFTAAASAAETNKPGRLGPTVKTYKGDKCVEDTEFMRRDHMKLILHQRDKTMHQGIRTSKHSLKNCVNCHADPKTNSVLGKDGFCESCHVYASVSIDCFSCHSSAPEKDPPPRQASEQTTNSLMGTTPNSATSKDHP